MSIIDESWYTNEITIVKLASCFTKELGHSLSDGITKLLSIVQDKTIPVNDRIEAFASLYVTPYSKKIDACHTLLPTLLPDVSSSDLIFMIFRNNVPQDICLTLSKIVNDTYLINSKEDLEKFEQEKPNISKLLLKCLAYLVQYSHYATDKTRYLKTIELIFKSTPDYYIKSESCDLLLRYGDKLQEILSETWFNSEIDGDQNCKTHEEKMLYLLTKNKQNVHLLDYEPVIEKIILRCRSEKYEIKEENGIISYQFTKITAQDILEDHRIFCLSDSNQTNLSETNLFDWIKEIQTSAVSFFGFNMWKIVQMCYFLFCSNPQKIELLKRFYEEIKESTDTCSSGYIVRLLNVFHGFDHELIMSMKFKNESILKLHLEISSAITKLKESEQNILLNAIQEKDKDTVEDFISCYLFFESEHLTQDEINNEIYKWFGFSSI